MTFRDYLLEIYRNIDIGDISEAEELQLKLLSIIGILNENTLVNCFKAEYIQYQEEQKEKS